MASSLSSTGFPTVAENSPCPCGTDRTFGTCCRPRHTRKAPATTPEELMRSRYSAFVVGDADYLLATWAEETRPGSLEFDPDIEWRRLRILGTSISPSSETHAPNDADTSSAGTVEFVAHFRDASGARDFQKENSRFVERGGRWFYLDGEVE